MTEKPQSPHVLEVRREGSRLLVDLDVTQDLLWQYAARCRMVDPVFSRGLEDLLYREGFTLPTAATAKLTELIETIAYLPEGALGYSQQPVPPYKCDIIPLAIHGLQHAIAAIKQQEVLKAAQEKTNE